jgi:acetylornithine deacetylase
MKDTLSMNNKSVSRIDAMAQKIASATTDITGELLTFIQKLIAAPSLPGEEKAVQEIVAAKLNSLGFDVATIPINLEQLLQHPAFSHDGFPVENRINVVGRWQGRGGNESHRSLILNGHVDVVSTGDENLWIDSPWSGKIRNGRIFGRGSADMKSGLSAAIFACQVLQSLGYQPAKEVIIQSVVGEETGGCGTLTNIMNGISADAAIITEPTQLKIYPVQSGALSFRLKITGKSIHACMKNQGISAIEKFYIIFQALEAFDKRRHQEYSNSIFEDAANVAPINIGTLVSGDWPSTVPDSLIAEGRYGIFPGEPVVDAQKAFEETLMQAASNDSWLKLHPPQVEWFEGQFESGSTAMNEPVIQTLSVCHRTMMDREIQFAGATYGSDLRLFTNYGKIPALLYGPGDVKDAHTIDESIAIDDITDAVKVLAYTIYNWCGGESNS